MSNSQSCLFSDEELDGCESPLPSIEGEEKGRHKRARTVLPESLYDFENPQALAKIARDEQSWRLAQTCAQLARGRAKKFVFGGHDYDDLVQDAFLSLWSAGKNYDPLMGTKYITTAHTWAFRQIKATWNEKFRRGMRGNIDSKAVENLYRDSKPGEGEEVLVYLTDHADDPAIEAEMNEWWIDLPDNPDWLKPLVKAMWVDFLGEKKAKKLLKVRNPKKFKRMLRKAQQIVAEHLGYPLVVVKGQSGKYKGISEEAWQKRLDMIEDKEMREIATLFFREGKSIREVAKECGLLSVEIEDHLLEIDSIWRNKK